MKVKHSEIFESRISDVWRVMTDLNDYAWRSDISRIEVFEQGKKFTEISTGGVETRFIVTDFQPVTRYAFSMENENFAGDWTGVITGGHCPAAADMGVIQYGLRVSAIFMVSQDREPLQRCLVPTGLYIALPKGFEAQVRPRSGLAIKKGITVLNSPGTIDADYRGEVCVILVNLSSEAFVIEDGERIAQMVIAKHEQPVWQEVEVLDETERGAGGFGHTGV